MVYHEQSVEMSARLAAPVRPCPLPVWAAVANELIWQEFKLMAVSPPSGVADVFETGQASTTPQSGLIWSEEKGWPFLKNGTKDHKLWPFGLMEFGTDFWKAADALSIKDMVLCQMRHSRPTMDISKQSRSLDAIMKMRKMAKRQNSDDARETRATGCGVSVVQQHADRAFSRSAQIVSRCDSSARRARRCADAMKSEVVVNVMDRLRELVRIEALKPKRGSLVESLLIKPSLLLCVPICFWTVEFLCTSGWCVWLSLGDSHFSYFAFRFAAVTQITSRVQRHG